MNDNLTMLLVECVNSNPNIDATQKLELVEYTIRNCKEKKIGKILLNHIEGRKKRGRPKGTTKTRTENQERMIAIAKENRSF